MAAVQINGAPLKHATNWMEQYRAFWEESFDRLEAIKNRHR